MSRLILLTFLAVSQLFSQAQNALCLDGNNDGINCGTSSLHTVSDTALTLEAWIYPRSFASNYYEGNVIVQESNSNNGGYMFRVADGGKINFSIGEGQAQDWAELTTAAITVLDSWQHIAASYDGHYLRIYLNGQIVDSLAETFKIAGHTNTPLTLGYHPTYGRYWHGGLDEVRIWDKALTKNDIQNNMHSEYCDTNLHLVAYYKFDKGAAYGSNGNLISATDYSYHQVAATLNNFAMTDSCSNVITGYALTQDTTTVNYSHTVCNSYYNPDLRQSFSSDTVLTYYLMGSNGCMDKIVRDITVNRNSYGSMTVSRCDSFIAPSGAIYRSTGIYQDRISNQIGCDSFITIDLKIEQSPLTERSIASCDSAFLTSSERWVKNSGIYYDSLINSAGCDSVIRYDVSLTASSYVDTTLRFCLFVFNPTGREVWSEEGIYYDTIANAIGCDSIIRYNVVSNKTYETLQVHSCGPYISPSGLKTWDSSGTFLDTLEFANSFNCDSIITVELSVSDTKYSEDSITACFFAELGSGKRVTSSGMYLDTLSSSVGCDSVVEYRVRIDKVNTLVTAEEFKLVALSSNASAFQWLNCEDNMSPISGATDFKFENPQHGRFAVEVTENECVDTSECYEVNGLGINELGRALRIYPNPAQGQFHLECLGVGAFLDVRLYNSNGQVVLVERLFSTDGLVDQTMSLQGLAEGLYLLDLRSHNRSARIVLMVR